MDPRLRIHGEHHGEGGKHVPSACPSAKTERERGGKRGEAVGKEAAQGAGAASWCWLRRRRGGGARSGERTRGGSAERGRSPKGSRGSEITVVVRSPVKRLLTWASVPARPSARRATCGSKVSGSTRSCRISVRPSVIRFSSSESRLVPPVLPDCSFRLWVRARSLCTERRRRRRWEEGGSNRWKKKKNRAPLYCGWLIRSLASSEESGLIKWRGTVDFHYFFRVPRDFLWVVRTVEVFDSVSVIVVSDRRPWTSEHLSTRTSSKSRIKSEDIMCSVDETTFQRRVNRAIILDLPCSLTCTRKPYLSVYRVENQLEREGEK